jgi:hypothetical protein
MSLYNNIVGRHTIIGLRRIIMRERHDEETDEIINREAADDP